MKKCTSCKQVKPIDEFYDRFNKDNINVFTSRCKECIKNRTKSWRKSEGKSKWKAYDDRRVAGNRKFLQEEREKGCVKCGESRFYVIDFHHLDPSTKEFTIGKTNRWTRTQLEKEIKKCIRLCRNCHSEFHYLEKNFNLKLENWLNEANQYKK